jgi:hypothetical protein
VSMVSPENRLSFRYLLRIIGRDGAQVLVKSDKDVSPLPNPKRHPSMRWDWFVYAPDPDAIAKKLSPRATSL